METLAWCNQVKQPVLHSVVKDTAFHADMCNLRASPSDSILTVLFQDQVKGQHEDYSRQIGGNPI
jgi:hypothetical protein